ncbi:MAG: RagB/SusD family nutrient uptake outer membrane protein, partial [Saprospiraceae bacterium]|nr:RagB/SusD family nutrient uptake outer membrane protein [Saprospiraceae bacterium]
MKKIFKYILPAFVFTMAMMVTSCSVDEIVDPNNPSLASVTNDASKAELQTLITGLEARHRNYYGSATQMFGSFGREVWAFFGSDPRFISHWLGTGISDTYPDFFASAGTYISPYLAVKQANVLIDAANASTSLTGPEQAGYSGFAKTVKGHQLLYPLLQQFNNGIRTDVADPLNPGPIQDYDDALAVIRNVLDEGFSELNGAAISFGLSSGYSGFSDAAGLASINRAIAARAALYAGDYPGALSALTNSFMNLNASTAAELQVGPAHVYGQSPDINNPLFYPFDRPTSTILVVHPALVEDALPGDGRLSKFAERVTNPAASAGLGIPGNYQDARWATNASPIPYIRNEELILIYAEAKLFTNDVDEAIDAINTIRNIWGVGPYTGGTSTDEV